MPVFHMFTSCAALPAATALAVLAAWDGPGDG